MAKRAGLGGEEYVTAKTRRRTSRELKALLERADFPVTTWIDWCAIGAVTRLVGMGAGRNTAAQRLIAAASWTRDSLRGGRRRRFRRFPHLRTGAIAERLLLRRRGRLYRRARMGRTLHARLRRLRERMRHPLVEALKTSAGYGLGARLVACLCRACRKSRPACSRFSSFRHAPEASRAEREMARRGASRGGARQARPRGEMEGGKVARYRILAPTEWNFHPEGRRGARSWAYRGGWRRSLRLARQSFLSCPPTLASAPM